MLAWQVACNSIVTYSNYARCRSVGMATVARRCDRALAMRSSFGDAIELWRCDRASRRDRARFRRCEPSSGLSSVITNINTSGT